MQIIGLFVGIYIAVLLTLLIYKLKDGISQIQQLNQVISEKLKTKYEIVNEMSTLEAKKKYIRLKAVIAEILGYLRPDLVEIISTALGGKKGNSYREGN